MSTASVEPFEYDTCELRYGSQLDENHFFGWLGELEFVESVEGGVIRITKPLSKPDLKDLVALFFRYGLDMRTLQHFLTRDNASWFKSEDTYWYKRVFEGDP